MSLPFVGIGPSILLIFSRFLFVRVLEQINFGHLENREFTAINVLYPTNASPHAYSMCAPPSFLRTCFGVRKWSIYTQRNNDLIGCDVIRFGTSRF
jgi:hypothetical protein